MARASSGINALIGIDKPKGPTSHDCVGRIRRIVGERRVGHAGTLDPAASGVLICGIGQATRLLGRLTQERKSYDACICFGRETTTDDAEGELVRQAPVPPELADPAFAQAQVAGLVGTHEQVPPAFSAISQGGKRAYERARAGEQVELPARSIEIYEAELVRIHTQESALIWECHFSVSKGTYIRSIARDMGRSLHTAAHLAALRRTASGGVELAQCVTLEVLLALAPDHLERAYLDPVELLGLRAYPLSAPEKQDALVGRHIFYDVSRTGEFAQAEEVCLVDGHELLGIWECEGSELVCVNNFPSGVSGVSS